jgi:hypothetical protein
MPQQGIELSSQTLAFARVQSLAARHIPTNVPTSRTSCGALRQAIVSFETIAYNQLAIVVRAMFQQ